MKIWFDTEFYENGLTIDLISIGAIREDGARYYAETDFAQSKCCTDWLAQNVKPHLTGGKAEISKAKIANQFLSFAGPEPEFWADYAAYDWVVLCQLYGTMMGLPKGWPMFCRDIQQLRETLGNPKLPTQSGKLHDALADAVYTQQCWDYLVNTYVPVIRSLSRQGGSNVP